LFRNAYEHGFSSWVKDYSKKMINRIISNILFIQKTQKIVFNPEKIP